MQKSTRISKVLLALLLMCYKATQVIEAKAKTVRDEIEILNQKPQNDIFAPVTEVVMQVLTVVGIVSVAIVIVIALIWFIKKKLK